MILDLQHYCILRKYAPDLTEPLEVEFGLMLLEKPDLAKNAIVCAEADISMLGHLISEQARARIFYRHCASLWKEALDGRRFGQSGLADPTPRFTLFWSQITKVERILDKVYPVSPNESFLALMLGWVTGSSDIFTNTQLEVAPWKDAFIADLVQEIRKEIGG